MTNPWPRIPYGEADFRRIRQNNWLYVDKTRFVRRLEDERHVVFIRPRRFGKSCWQSLLECYYDRRWAGDFEAIFGGTEIGRAPTGERSRYATLRFDFSAVNDDPDRIEASFEDHCATRLGGVLGRHPDLFPNAVRDRILDGPAITEKLSRLFEFSGDRDIPLYVLIDEYDNFANTILAHHGTDAYEKLTHGGGFYRNFFATLKAGVGQTGSGLERLFITGVSPVTLDDLTSGFNIGRNLSLHPDFNELLGFTEAEVRGLLELYRDKGAFNQDIDAALGVMRQWYNGYRFADEAETDLYNTDMVLYYLAESIPNRKVPNYLIDSNVRIDYGKLRHLLVVNRRAVAGKAHPNGAFDLLRRVIGEEVAETRIEPSFRLRDMARRENFLSLLHYFGLLSIRGAGDNGTCLLGIPNQTVRQLLYRQLRQAYEDQGAFEVDFYEFERLIRRMANEGEWRPVFERLAAAVAAQTGIRDYIAGEKVLQGFLAAYLSMTDYYVFRSEAELGKGHADIALEPIVAKYPHLRRGYLIELKYLARGEQAGKKRVEALAQEADAQLQRYLAEPRLERQFPDVEFTGIALVFHGWEMVHCAEV